MLDAVLALTADMPTRALAAGEPLFVEGEASSTFVVLVEGEVIVDAGGVVVDRHTAPGTFLGEIGALLGNGRTASVTAASSTVVRELGALGGVVPSPTRPAAIRNPQ